ncbi:MAG: YfiR family protein [Geobacteraceae bacterium]|nr:YfiR family protein [Geobacteraceae bacterium]NTW80170.1 YfiR family protein [Geobacteraceae bacterium]
MKVKLYNIVVLLLLSLGLDMASIAYSAQLDENQIKAVFVLNFAKLAEWPIGIADDNSTFTIAILGKAPSSAFVKTLQSQTVHGVKVSVRHIDEVGEAKGARLLYISGTERRQLPRIMRELGNQSILTVSDITGFCEAGGMIGLVPVQNRLGFDINIVPVRKSRLTLSSQLLKLARTIVGNTPQ